ncbi:MAG: molybdopterin-dependent oxidoreductase [Acidobacteriaceae bacterium]|nr:molybdopterin-dependent oxidoreductase [Acidobacteriaceae bacterium]
MGASFGRGGATTALQDLANADCIVIEGSNMAECHPVGFRWVMEAKQRGATIIHVDPRFTRTSAVSDVYVPIRAGTDIVFLGALISYVINNERYFREYVVSYTNAPAILREDYRDPEDLDGLFSDWREDKGQYEGPTWRYEGAEHQDQESHRVPESHAERSAYFAGPKVKAHSVDHTLQHPRCVFQVVKRHFQRYTPEMVEEVCGIPPALFHKVAETLCRNSGRERTSAFCYAVGWTQHSAGPQFIRAAGILQLLLGNVGRPGGGILALRGHATIQGSTDVPTLYNLLPGYIPMPKTGADNSLDKYIENYTARSGWWTETPKYITSLLKAWFGDAATQENGFCFNHLPKLTGDHSHMTTVVNMADGEVKGYLVMGENAVVGSPNAGLQRKGLRNLEWLVVRDFYLVETAEFWKDSPEHERGEVSAQTIGTEVFFFPAATHTEKNGSFTQTQRVVQWHHAAIEPPGDCRSELHFAYHLGKRLKELYADSTDPKDRPIQDLAWNYPTQGAIEEPSAEAVVAEINGYTVADRKPVAGFVDLKADGSTACGCWIYSGIYAGGVNRAANKKPATDRYHYGPEWGFAWPANRRILYNRAAADPDGHPWSERKALVWWDDAKQEWTGYDVPDFMKHVRPDYRAPENSQGVETISGDDPFLLQPDGKGWLFAPTGLQDGPLPTHYEPIESIVKNPLYGQQCNPVRFEYLRRENQIARPFDDARFPYVATTYRLTEHHTTGGMSRWLSWLAELQPEMFCEISPELAQEVGLRNGDWATILTARAEIEARVLVTERIRPLKMGRRTFHQIGLPYHWGNRGLVTGDGANELVAFTGDPNVTIQESKALTCNIRPGRRNRHEPHRRSWEDAPEEALRDLPVARFRPEGGHHVHSPASKQGDQT